MVNRLLSITWGAGIELFSFVTKVFRLLDLIRLVVGRYFLAL